jgi:hypothetical protein
MANNIIKGRKGGSSSPRTPTEQPDDLQSVAKAKILIALGEGEFAGELTGKGIYLDGTPLKCRRLGKLRVLYGISAPVRRLRRISRVFPEQKMK